MNDFLSVQRIKYCSGGWWRYCLPKNLVMKNISDERLKVYKSIFPKKNSRSLFGLEITSMKVLRSQKLDLKHTNTWWMRIEGLHVDFSQNVTFSPCAWICICRGFISIRKSVLNMKTRPDHVFRVFGSIFEKESIYLILWLQI